MSTTLNLMTIENSMQTIISTNSAVSALGTTVLVEPYEQDIYFPSISIFRVEAPLTITTINRVFEVKPVINLECAVVNFDVNKTLSSVDTLTEAVLRVVVDNKQWGNPTVVKTSRPIRVDYRLGKDSEGYMAMAIIPVELTIVYQ